LCGAGCRVFSLLGRAGREAGISSYSNLLATLVGVCAVGLAIRLMDDFLDAALDLRQGLQTPAHRFGSASLPYALAGLSVGSLLAPRLAATLFLGAYAVGMASDPTRALPSGLRGYQESLLAMLIGTLGAGPMLMTWAMTMMIAIQALDDLVDLRIDKHTGGRNWCHLYGTGEVMLCGLLCVAIGASLSLMLTLLTLIVTTVIDRIFHRRSGTVIV
jgi:4-hydroxybenzoate polyprenyltransferase